MQDKTLEEDFVMLAVPIEVIEESGIADGKVLQFTAEKGKIIIENVDRIDDIVCLNDCKDCPIYEQMGEKCPNKI